MPLSLIRASIPLLPNHLTKLPTAQSCPVQSRPSTLNIYKCRAQEVVTRPHISVSYWVEVPMPIPVEHILLQPYSLSLYRWSCASHGRYGLACTDPTQNVLASLASIPIHTLENANLCQASSNIQEKLWAPLPIYGSDHIPTLAPPMGYLYP